MDECSVIVIMGIALKNMHCDRSHCIKWIWIWRTYQNLILQKLLKISYFPKIDFNKQFFESRPNIKTRLWIQNVLKPYKINSKSNWHIWSFQEYDIWLIIRNISCSWKQLKCVLSRKTSYNSKNRTSCLYSARITFQPYFIIPDIWH